MGGEHTLATCSINHALTSNCIYPQALATVDCVLVGFVNNLRRHSDTQKLYGRMCWSTVGVSLYATLRTMSVRNCQSKRMQTRIPLPRTYPFRIYSLMLSLKGNQNQMLGHQYRTRKNIFDMDFTNRSQDNKIALLCTSTTPSVIELYDRSDADEGQGIAIGEDPDSVPRDRLFAEADGLEIIEGGADEILPVFDEHPVIRNAHVHVTFLFSGSKSVKL